MEFSDNINNLEYIENKIRDLYEIGYDACTIGEILNVLPEYVMHIIHKYDR